MDPVTLIVGPGFVGGLVIAFLIFRHQRRSSGGGLLTESSGTEQFSTDVINAASIKVAGVGGLGLVAMAAAVALNVPRIGQTVGLGLVLGLGFALVMILHRRRSGSMPSSGRQPGANTTLAIDAAAPPAEPRPVDRDLLDLLTTRA